MNVSLFYPVSLGPYETAKEAKDGQETVTQGSLLALELRQWVKFPQNYETDKNAPIVKI